MIKFIIKLAFTALVAYFTWHVGSAYVGFYRLKDAAEQAAMIPRLTDAQIRARVMQLAEDNDARLEEDDVEIRRDTRHIFIDAAYVQPIEVLPGYVYPWHFAWSVDVLIIPGAVAPEAGRPSRTPPP